MRRRPNNKSDSGVPAITRGGFKENEMTGLHSSSIVFTGLGIAIEVSLFNDAVIHAYISGLSLGGGGVHFLLPLSLRPRKMKRWPLIIRTWRNSTRRAVVRTGHRSPVEWGARSGRNAMVAAVFDCTRGGMRKKRRKNCQLLGGENVRWWKRELLCGGLGRRLKFSRMNNYWSMLCAQETEDVFLKRIFCRFSLFCTVWWVMGAQWTCSGAPGDSNWHLSQIPLWPSFFSPPPPPLIITYHCTPHSSVSKFKNKHEMHQKHFYTKSKYFHEKIFFIQKI